MTMDSFLWREKKLHADVRNYGISGTRLAKQRAPSEKPYYNRYFSSRVKEMNNDADLVLFLVALMIMGMEMHLSAKLVIKQPIHFVALLMN